MGYFNSLIHSNFRATILPVTFFFVIFSCQREPIPESDAEPVDRLVPVSVSFCLADPLDGTSERTVSYPPTKATIDVQDASCIKNIWVLQYGGTDGSDSLFVNPVYYPSVTVEDGKVKEDIMLGITSDVSTVLFIANTFDEGLVFPGTLGGLLSMAKNITEQDDLMGYDGTDHHLIFSAWCTPAEITSGTVISANLSRNVAKVNLHIVNNSYNESEKVTVHSVSLHSVQGVSFFLPSYGSPEIFPAANTYSTIDYPSITWSGSGDQGSGTASCDFSFYVPVNKRGSTANDMPSAKPLFAPAQATYATVECSYLADGVQIPVNYCFYLGANLTDDFNIESNKSYNYTIEIKNKGDGESDARVHNLGATVDYSLGKYERANCYILNPPSVDDYWRTFKIPVDRINTFWGLTSNKYEYDSDRHLVSESEWEVQVVWSDFTFDNSDFRFTGNGTTFSGTGTDPISVEIKKGAKGNVVIGLKKKIGDEYSDYLWSWHLWITDYSPDDITKYGIVPSDNINDYNVGGGKVYRLDGPDWTTETGRYRNSFIMDRNIGAPDIKYHYYNEPGVLYYQFGRKDPLYYPKSRTAVSRNNAAVVETEDCPARPIHYSIAHPDIFISGSYHWTIGNKYNPDTDDRNVLRNILWQDPNATAINHKKSIFDPCPGGWEIPESYNSSVSSSRFVRSSSRMNLYNGTVPFPEFYFRSWNGSFIAGYRYYCYWASAPGTRDYGLTLNLYSSFDDIYVGDYLKRVCGSPVRCVQK